MKFNLICVEETSGKVHTFKHYVESWWEIREVVKSFMAMLVMGRVAKDNLVYSECPEMATATISTSIGIPLCTFYASVVQEGKWDGTYRSHDWTRSDVLVDTAIPRKSEC